MIRKILILLSSCSSRGRAKVTVLKLMKKVLIVGGGTAGVTIADRLAPYADVVVLERSKYRQYPLLFRIPLLGGLLFQSGKYVRKVLLQSGVRGALPFFESNVLGGASAINGCVHAVGSLQRWQTVFAETAFGEEGVMRAYQACYSASGKKGSLSLKEASQDKLDRQFLQTLDQAGVPVGDMSFSDRPKCGAILINTGRWVRSSVVSAFFHRRRYHVEMGGDVNRLVLNQTGDCIGVYVEGRLMKADYVIVAGGVIGTTALLSKTQNYMQKSGAQMFNLSSLGTGIKDHPNLRIKVLCRAGYKTLNEISHSLFLKAVEFSKHLVGYPSLMRTPGATSAAYLDLDEDGVVDTKIQLVHFTEKGRLGSDDPKQLFDSRPGFSLAITLLNPKSSGKIDSQGRVDPGYFAEKEDLNLMKCGLNYALNLLQSEPLSSVVEAVIDQQEIEADAEQYVLNHFFSGYHLIGGVSVGKEGKLLDQKLKMRGVEGLYVCDASVFESHVSSNTHAPVVLLADQFARSFVKDELQG
jgi:choline dehydrogenase-like flavoprotein